MCIRDRYEKKLEDYGVKIIEFTDDELQNFYNKCWESVWPEPVSYTHLDVYKRQGKPVEVSEGSTIMEAAETVGIRIPSLCHMKNVHQLSLIHI